MPSSRPAFKTTHSIRGVDGSKEGLAFLPSLEKTDFGLLGTLGFEITPALTGTGVEMSGTAPVNAGAGEMMGIGGSV
jgi:hypothetical protein